MVRGYINFPWYECILMRYIDSGERRYISCNVPGYMWTGARGYVLVFYF